MAAPWANLAAVVIMVSLFVWFLVHHQPAREKRAEERADQKDALFLQTLREERERAREAAASGHAAARALSENIGNMTSEIRRFNDQQIGHHNG